MAEGEERWTIWRNEREWEDVVEGPHADGVEVVRVSRFEEVQKEADQYKAMAADTFGLATADMDVWRGRAERAEAERDDAVKLAIARLLDARKVRADLERAQELIARLKQELENIDLVAGYDVEALAEAEVRERGVQ